MVTYYAAMGKYRLEQFDGGSRPVILLAGKEYGVTIPEYILWNALLWNILNYDALRTDCLQKARRFHIPMAEADFDRILERLLFRGLIRKGQGFTGAAALQELFREVCLIPIQLSPLQCESIVEKQKGKQESKRSEQVKEQTLKRANMRGRLNPRMSLHPVKKGFNRLSATADIGAEAVSRLQNIIRPFLSWSRKFKGIHLPQFLFPCRIYIGPVGKQGPIGDRCKLQHHLLCCPEVTVRSLRDLNCTGNG